ncbi:MAG: glycoside hydrolase family 105 protein, partial [Lachnospirales bacterium]
TVNASSLESTRQAKINTMLDTLLAETDPGDSDGSLWNSESNDLKWSYINGCMITAFMDLYEVTGNTTYLDNSNTYQSVFVNSSGEVQGTNSISSSKTLDDVNPGKSLLDLIENNAGNKERFELCVDNEITPILGRVNRVENGTLNFFHKADYQHQVWLDGTYMALPYMIQYKRIYPSKSIAGKSTMTEVANDVTAQFENVYNKMRNNTTGLYYHGYNSRADNNSADYNISKAMSWARTEADEAASGNYKVSDVYSTAERDACSSNYWSRAMGWYAMALVDSYEEMSKVTDGIDLSTQKKKIADIFVDLMDSVLNYQDSSTGLWYQVMDNPTGEYNYLESSGTATFAAALMKGYNLGIYSDTSGYTPKKTDDEYYSLGLKAFNGLTDNKLNTTGGLTDICGTAGLGGVNESGSKKGHTSSSATRGYTYNYRDGSYKYYVSEKLATNDAKGAAPYLMAYAQKIKHDQNAQ